MLLGEELEVGVELGVVAGVEEDRVDGEEEARGGGEVGRLRVARGRVVSWVVGMHTKRNSTHIASLLLEDEELVERLLLLAVLRAERGELESVRRLGRGTRLA